MRVHWFNMLMLGRNKRNAVAVFLCTLPSSANCCCCSAAAARAVAPLRICNHSHTLACAHSLIACALPPTQSTRAARPYVLCCYVAHAQSGGRGGGGQGDGGGGGGGGTPRGRQRARLPAQCGGGAAARGAGGVSAGAQPQGGGLEQEGPGQIDNTGATGDTGGDEFDGVRDGAAWSFKRRRAV
jgi:hypothetical protein